MRFTRIAAAIVSLCMAASTMTVWAENILPGDVNGSGKLEVMDAVMLQKWLHGNPVEGFSLKYADLNNDGEVDIFDLALLKQRILEVEPDADFSAVSLSEHVTPNAVTGTEADDAFILGQTAFALSLLQNTVEDKNILLSPYSAVQALGMTANGADGQTKSEMEQVIGGMPMEKLNAYLYTQRMGQPDSEKCSLQTANSVWFRDSEDLTIYPDFLQTNADYYGADAYKVPFDSGTLRDINHWVNNRTHGMIPKLFQNEDKEPEDEILLYLINAVAFEAEWAEPYIYVDQIRKKTFTALDGTRQDAEMLNSKEKYYLEDEHATGFLKYYADRRYAFAALLPEKGLSVTEYIAELTAEGLHETLDNPTAVTVYAELPKFSYDYRIDLNDTLKTMGMPMAFDELEADFSGMGYFNDDNLRIGKVEQMTHIDVYEEGTRAAALTAVSTEAPTEAPEPEQPPKYVTLDRPFVYCIVDTETALPVFIGALMEIPE